MSEKNERNESRNPDEIEADIHETRAHLDHTLHELENRLSPKQFMDSIYEQARNGGANEFFANLGKTIKENPVPFLLTGIGVGWLMMAHRKTNQQSTGQESHGSSYDSSNYRASTTMPARPTASTSAPPPQAGNANRPVETSGSAATPSAIKGTKATHTGTATTSSTTTPTRADTVGEATHLGTGQDGQSPTRT